MPENVHKGPKGAWERTELTVLVEELARLLDSRTWKAMLPPSYQRKETDSSLRVHIRPADMLRETAEVYTTFIVSFIAFMFRSNEKKTFS